MLASLGPISQDTTPDELGAYAVAFVQKLRSLRDDPKIPDGNPEVRRHTFAMVKLSIRRQPDRYRRVGSVSRAEYLADPKNTERDAAELEECGTYLQSRGIL